MPCAEVEDLLQWASQAVAKEQKQLPRDFDIDNGSKGYVKARHRDNSLAQLLKLSNHFGFSPETFASAVMLTDRFLGLVKVYPKYMQCVSMAGLLVSAKINEEEEFVPTVDDFIRIGQCDCTAGDLKRMEKLMVDKLNWDLLSITPIYFLHKFLQLFVTFGLIRATEVSSAVQRLTTSLLAMLCKKSIFQHKGSSLALCLLWYDLDREGVNDSNTVIDVARFLGVSDHEFMHCVGVVSDFMELSMTTPCVVSRKRKRSAMFSAKILPTIVEATPNAESESEDEVEKVNSDNPVLQTTPVNPPALSLEASDKQNHLQEISNQKPLYSTVVKSSCGTMLCKELPVIFKDQALVF